MQHTNFKPSAKMQNLILKIKNGDFDGAISCLLQNNMDMSNTNVLNIIITSCTVCTEKQIQADDEAVCNLLRMCVSYIKEPKDTHIDQYLRSVYFILKYLLDKVSYNRSCLVSNLYFIRELFTGKLFDGDWFTRNSTANFLSIDF